MTELKNRGVQDIFIACVDGLKGFPEAIETDYPKAAAQLCIVHMVSNSLNYVGWNKREQVDDDLKRVYTAATESEAELYLLDLNMPGVMLIHRLAILAQQLGGYYAVL